MKHISAALGALAIALLPHAAVAETRPMTAQDLVTLKRVGAPAVSPDGQTVVFQQTDTDPASYKRTPGLWRVPAKGGAAVRIADLPDAGESAPAFSPDGKHVAYWAGRGDLRMVVMDKAEGRNYGITEGRRS